MENQTENQENQAIKRRRNFRPLIFAGLIIVAIIVAVVVFINLTKKSDTAKNSETGIETETKKAEESAKTEEKTAENSAETKKDEELDGKTPSQGEGEDANSLGELTGAVNYAAVEGEELVIRVTIDQYLASGVCSLHLESPLTGDTYDVASEIAPAAATSSCAGFNVPLSSLMTGEYNITVELSAGGKTGRVAGKVEI